MKLREIKRRLRGTLIHKVYTLVRYDLYLILIFRLYYNLRMRRIRKVINYIIYKFHSLYLELPRSIAIDIVSCCNLRCPLCSVPPFITKTKGNFMSFSDFNKIVRNLNVSAEEICLVYAGEPYLHPKFFDMIKALSSKFYTSTITNGTLLDGERIEKTLKCGLDSLQISFDGFRRESYEKYRVGANFDGVKNNVLNLFAAKRKKKYGLPLITMTYLVNAYNQDEVDDCRRFFLVNGANRFFAKAINLNVHRRKDGKTEQDLIHWLPNQHDISLYHEDETGISFRERQGVCTTCLSPIIRTDGEILICCHDIFNSVKIGNIFEKDFYSIWFGEYYKKLRKLGKERKLPICQKCGK